MEITSKEQLFALPQLADKPPEDSFQGQAHICTYNANTPGECPFISVEKMGGSRPQCPDHDKRYMAWYNLRLVNGVMYRQYPGWAHHRLCSCTGGAGFEPSTARFSCQPKIIAETKRAGVY